MKFTHLHTHSHYSLLQALPKLPELIEAAKVDGMEALALTDNGNMYGAIEFYKECQKQGIKPIIGVDAYLASRTRFDKQAGVDKDRFRLVLLCKSEIGYKNLLKLVTASYLEGFYYKPRVDIELLEKYSEGLICISGSWSGDISTAVRNRNFELAKELVQKYKKIFKEEDFYIEITKHPELEGHNEHMVVLSNFAKENGVSIVASHDVYYIKLEDREARNTLMAVQQGAPQGGERGAWDEDENFSFLSTEDMKSRFADMPEAIFNNQKISGLCNLELELGKWAFPDIIIESGKSYDDELHDLAYNGLERRGLPKSDEIITRLEYELGVIKTKGYSPYFLVVADLMNYAHDHGILTNIRGSVSGSLTTFASHITNINPLEYEIPFERFLNPDRPSAPDIDMDFADNRRDEMVEYVKQKYGADKVAQIGTFGTMAARGSVRDTARALGFAYTLGDRIAKLIPMGAQGHPMTIDRALTEVPELLELYKKDVESKKIIDMAKKIEGCARHIGVHAAGVVISPTDLTNFTPLQLDPKGEGKIITQYDMYSVDENGAGLLKFDFLGLKNLSIIAATIELLKKTKNVEINPDNIPIDDKKTFEMLARGETEDLFQLNGDGMTRFLVELKPSSIHDINAMVALYRPGPMQFIPNYIERKHDASKITYADPALEPILKKTYGILVYQDDLLMMAHKLAGYSWGEVDKFRKAVGKKIPEEMEKQREKFIKGCMEYSKWTEKKAKEVWKWIEPFASYGFNKAHSVSYGRVAYQTAYLKANYPGEYMRAVLSAESGDTEKVATSINECKRIGIEILPPDINESFSDFTLVKKPARLASESVAGGEVADNKETIRFGLTTIKNFGEGISHTITAERKENGKFKSLEDFLRRIQDRNLNKKSMDALIKAGAFDNFDERGQMIANMDNLLEYNKESVGNKDQHSLFSATPTLDYSPLHLNPSEPATATEKLAWEKELLGLYVSGHPLEQFKEKLANQKNSIKNIKENAKENEIVVVGGLIENMRDILTKNGDKMFFIKFADLTDEIEMVVFPRTLQEFSSIFVLDECIAVKARVSLRNGEKSLIAEKAKKL
ncbi:MAG: DNA polymerase III subunit alpha [Candidatus Zambryskibacteria bacterium RIFOXYC1_FULL_39_10]|uniref:DNA polymerase III subunit alpha n=1 Tax=Candidatus Zambryskibacteria bacterium RIFOXYC1_FULL_39_10 TaxID=1802779 RepID=A0A1G2V2G9_9BACT|nr:MAG: DNA polymerase III subunit alpha [Candidatus Zambryskibacteria bacterium RIFOXYC1_FULL_39_10]OHB16867.1 MAG: DNA polymerase III subunit alpha [Candidatus Zambryskibacteria bacterium RIFOXYD1_FULL_39_35]